MTVLIHGIPVEFHDGEIKRRDGKPMTEELRRAACDHETRVNWDWMDFCAEDGRDPFKGAGE